jgi:hypothetical protein
MIDARHFVVLITSAKTFMRGQLTARPWRVCQTRRASTRAVVDDGQAVRFGFDEEHRMNQFPDDQQRVWIQLEREDERRQAVFDLPTKTFTPDDDRAFHANEVVEWVPIA